MTSSNTVWHHATVTREHREKLNKYKSVDKVIELLVTRGIVTSSQ